MKRIGTGLVLFCIVFTLFAASKPSIEGRAMVAEPNVFPQGLFAKAIGFLPGDSVSVINPSTGVSVNVLILGTLDLQDGIAVLLSPEAAGRLFIAKNSNTLVSVTKRVGETVDSIARKNVSDPDSNPEDAIPFELEQKLLRQQNPLGAEFAAAPPVVSDIPSPIAFPVASAYTPEVRTAGSPGTDGYGPDVRIGGGVNGSEAYPTPVIRVADVPPPVLPMPVETPPPAAAVPTAVVPVSPAVPVSDEVKYTGDTAAPVEKSAPPPEEPVKFPEQPAPPREESVTPRDTDISNVRIAEGAPPPEEPAVNLSDLPPPEVSEVDPIKISDLPLADAPVTSESASEPAGEDLKIGGAAPLWIGGENALVKFNSMDEPVVENTEVVSEEPAAIALIPPLKIEGVRLMPAPLLEPVRESDVKLEETAAETKETVVKAGEEVPTEVAVKADEEVPAETTEVAVKVDEKVPVVTETPPEPAKLAGMIVEPAKLKAGAYYVQIATMSDEKNINALLGNYGDKYPLALVPSSISSAYQVLVGPLNVDEYGVVLTRFQNNGYKDAFLRKVP